MGKKLSAKGKQKKKQRLTVVFLLVIIVVAVVVSTAAILLYLKENADNFGSSSSLSSDSVSSESTDSSAQSAEFSAVSEFSAVDDSYFDDAVFVGDSLTVGLGNYGVLPAENIYADIGLNLDTILTKECIQTSDGSVTVLNALKLKKPSKVYIMLGSNGIAWITPEKLAEKYAAFLSKVKAELPDATIYVESILPVTAEKQAGDARYSNEAIVEYNKLLFNLAKEQKVNYLDCHTEFKMSDGTLNTEYAEQDGMHLKKVGYNALFEFFKTHTVK